jgi:hypothetical protein
MSRGLLLFLALLLTIGGWVSACGGEGEEGAPTLASSHPGWLQPDCWSCHDRGSTHNSDKSPYECTACHGRNGAPAGHGGETPCASCHATPHGADGFPDPASCQACHPS